MSRSPSLVCATISLPVPPPACLTQRRRIAPFHIFRTATIAILLILGVPPEPVQAIDVGVVDSRADATHPDLEERVDFPFGQRTDLNAALHVPQSIKDHGTKVASVIANETSSSVRVASIVWDYRDSDRWYPARERCLADPDACGAARGLLEDEFAFYARLWTQLPIVNSSFGLYEYETTLLQPEGARIPDLVEQIKARNRALWNRYVQADRPSQDRSIHVRSTGYIHDGNGRPALNFHPLLVHASPELWDHTLFVTALRPDGRGLFGPARPCGTPPPAWFSPDRPPHFCVAAPGTHEVAVPGGGQEPGKGPSFAAPYVAAILAEMSLRCDLRGPALIERLLESADRTGPYSDVNTYGAGVVTRKRAEEVCKS